MRNIVITALFWGLAAAAPGQADEPAKPSAPAKADAAGQQKAKAPWQRVLTGEDAKRVADLKGKLEKLQEAGSLPEARAVAQEILEVRTRQQGADHWQTVSAQWQLKTLRKIEALPAVDQNDWVSFLKCRRDAHELGRKRRYREAQPLLQKILDLHLKLLGENHPDTAQSYNNLASNLYAQRQYTQAQRLFQKALNLRQKVLGEGHPDTAMSYGNLAFNLQAQGQYAQAQPLLQKSLDLNRKLLGEDHLQTVTSYNNLAANLDNQGRCAQAQPLYQKALDLRLKLQGENHPDTAGSYNNLAFNLDCQLQYAQAQLLHQKALDLDRKLLGENSLTTAQDYNSLASNLRAQGRYAQAQPLFQKALDLRLKLLGEHHTATAQSYNNLALSLQGQGQYAQAQPLYQKALDLRRQLLGEYNPATAQGYNNLAMNLTAQGRYAQAQPLCQKALDLHLKLFGEHHLATAQSYHNLAINLGAQGRYAQAQPLFQRALDLRRQLLGENNPDTASCYESLAVDLDGQGQYPQAQPLFQKALGLHLKLLGEYHPVTAISYGNLAFNLQAQGRYAQAQPLCQKALNLNRKQLGEDHPHTARDYYRLAGNFCAQGDYDQAEQLLLKAARSVTQARLFASLSGAERATIAALPSPLPLLTAVSVRNGKPGLAWTHLEEDLGRGLLDDLAARQLAAQHLSPQERQRQQDLLANLQRQDKLFQKPPPRSGDNAKGQKRWTELSRQYREAQTALSQFQADMAQKYGVATGQAYDLAHIQAQLPADAALLTCVDVQGQPKAADPNGEHWACLVRAKGTPIWVRLPGSGAQGAWTKEDDDLPHRLRQALAKHQEDSSELARKLAAQRLAPLEKHLDAAGPLPAVKHLIVLPVRWMAGVPVEALTDRFTISYAPSGTLFARLREQHPAAAIARAPARLLAVGDPAFAPPVVKAKPAPQPPDHGVLLNVVQRGSNADHAGLKSGDVLLSYAGTQLANPAALRQAIGQHRPKSDSPTRGVQTVALTVWREGQTLELSAAPGPLGVMPSKDAAAVGIQARREGDALLRGLRGDTLPPLPGSRTEVQAIAGLFSDAEMLIGSEASEQRLDELGAPGRLRQFRYLHFATHGIMNDRIPLQSSLALAQDHLPDPLAQVLAGKKAYDGRLTAEQILQSWKLDADLVTLSACQTGLGRQGGGDGYIGFAQVLFLAGARSLVLSLWEVDDRATALLMVRFYQNLLGKRDGLMKPLPKAEALAEAKRWLRGLSREEVERLVKALPGGTRLGKSKDSSPVVNAVARPFAHPYCWSAFILIGDPD